MIDLTHLPLHTSLAEWPAADALPGDAERWNKMDMRCDHCGCAFAHYQAVPCPVDALVSLSRKLRCPHCGAGPKGIMLGAARSLPEDLRIAEMGNAPRDGSEHALVFKWRLDGEVGQSAAAIADTMLGHEVPPGGELPHPRDIDDFRRCVLLLERIPSFRERLSRMRISPAWDALVDAWSDIEAALRADTSDLTIVYRPKSMRDERPRTASAVFSAAMAKSAV